VTERDRKGWIARMDREKSKDTEIRTEKDRK
jgi:hypothetical protein